MLKMTTVSTVCMACFLLVYTTASAGFAKNPVTGKSLGKPYFVRQPVFKTLDNYLAYKNKKETFGDDSAKAYLKNLAMDNHQPVRKTTRAVIKENLEASVYAPVFTQGGGAWAQDQVLGSLDGYSLDFITNGALQYIIQPDGTLTNRFGTFTLTQAGYLMMASGAYPDGFFFVDQLGARAAGIGDFNGDYNHTSIYVDDNNQVINYFTQGSHDFTGITNFDNGINLGDYLSASRWTIYNNGNFYFPGATIYNNGYVLLGTGGASYTYDGLFSLDPSVGLAGMGDIQDVVNGTYVNVDDRNLQIVLNTSSGRINMNGTVNVYGSMGIGTTSPLNSYKFAVEGKLGARKIVVTQAATWADYVFDSSYQLKPLSNVEQFIKENKHLPEVPTTKEVEKNGVDLGDNAALLLKKIEELTLYIIAQDKKQEQQAQQLQALQKEIDALKQAKTK